jgi:predicted nucleic acid-binding protein
VELADTSAWIWSRRSHHPLARWAFDRQLELGRIATCDMVRFELLRGAPNADEFEQTEWRLSALPDPRITVREWRRALHVYRRLADGSWYVLGVAGVTGQPHRWLAPPGSRGAA